MRGRVLAGLVLALALALGGCTSTSTSPNSPGSAPKVPGAGASTAATPAGNVRLPEKVQAAPVKVLPADQEKKDATVGVYTIADKGQVTVTISRGPEAAKGFDELVGQLDDVVPVTHGSCGTIKGNPSCYQRLDDGMVASAAKGESLSVKDLADFAGRLYESL